MRTEITFLKKALPGGCKSWQGPVHLNRGLSKKKTQRAPKIIGRTEQEKTNYASHFSVHFFAFFCTKRKSLGENKCQDIFLSSTSRMSSHKYVVSFLSSFSELLLVSMGLFTWYRNDFHSEMSFVPEWSSYCIGTAPRRFRARSDTNAPLALDYTICDFQSGTKFVFSLHYTRIKFRRRTRISLAMETGMTSLQNDLYENEMSFQYRVI